MKQISYQEYRKLFAGKEKNALDKAWEIRNFEIQLYWNRATYFWTFIAITLGGYLTLISSDSYNNNLSNVFPQIEYFIICLGIVLSFAWFYVNKASKKWQANWEKHIDMLEIEITGPLYQTIKHNENHSVSKINIIVSSFFIFIWFGIAIAYFKRHHYSIFVCDGYSLDWYVLISNIFTIAFILFLKYGCGKSNFEEEEFRFYKRESKYHLNYEPVIKKNKIIMFFRRIIVDITEKITK